MFDEAIAFADPENEYKIQLAFEKLMKEKTVLMIAHIKKNGLFSKLVSLQQQSFNCSIGN